MGKRMFEGGERGWPEEAPFHTPVYVLTHEKREPWVRPGGTTFYFVNDGIASALEQARLSAGERDIRISGGPMSSSSTWLQGWSTSSKSPCAGAVRRRAAGLFENIGEAVPAFKIDRVLDTPSRYPPALCAGIRCQFTVPFSAGGSRRLGSSL